MDGLILPELPAEIQTVVDSLFQYMRAGLGFVFLFFANGTIAGTVIGIVVCLVTYFFETFIDNNFARMKWNVALNSSWLVAITLGMINIVVLYFM